MNLLYVLIIRNLENKLTLQNIKHYINDKPIGIYLETSGGLSLISFLAPTFEKVIQRTQNSKQIIPITCFLINLSL